VLAIEAKADEPFGEMVADAMAAALERRVANHSSRGVERIVSLVQSLFGERTRGQREVSTLRYQLLTATAGALAAAARANANRVVMLVEEFRTAKTTDAKHAANAKDLDAFVQRLSQGTVSSCAPGQIIGPFSIPGAPLFDRVPELYIGKVVHDRRARTADEAVEAALRALGGTRSTAEVREWIEANLNGSWKDIATTMADMTFPPRDSSSYPEARQLLERVAKAQYRLRG